MKKMLIGIAAVVLYSSCTQVAGWFGNENTQVNVDSSSHAAFARDVSITAENSYSDLFLDSSAINGYIKENNLADSIAQKLNNFYLVRNYQYAWFASEGATEPARGLWSLYAKEHSDSSSRDLSQTIVDSTRGLNELMDSILQDDSVNITAKDSNFAGTELALTHQFILYASEHPGHINSEMLYYMVPAKKQDAMQLADSIVNNKLDSSFFAHNDIYQQLKSQLASYYNIAKNKSWDSITSSKGIQKGKSAPVISLIKKRLQATGEYNSNDTSAVFNDSLALAISSYQERNGLKPTGEINDSLINNLNIPARQRVEQILVNMNRALWLPPQNDSTKVLVNIPTQMLYVFSDSGKVMEMPVVIGKQGYGTVVFSGEISKIVFNPSWNIPESIVREEILPEMRSDAQYLEKNNMEIISDEEGIPVIKQLPGKDNPLGEVKFLFPNTHAIYFHDTPDKSLFNKKDRALSHGCIRVADAGKLAVYLLQQQGDWNKERITRAMKGNEEQVVELRTAYPVSITYLTAFVDDNGLLNFRSDIYGHDGDTMNRMFI